jgi:polyhydroxyalkanoate synthesis regulator phasin
MDMLDLIKKTMLTGLGLAFLTKEKLEEIGRDIAERGSLSKKEGREFIEELGRKSEQARKRLQEEVDKAVAAAVKRMNLATKDDLDKLRKEISALKKALKREKERK